MRVVVTGADGQVGRALMRIAPPTWEVIPSTLADTDFTRLASLDELVTRCTPDTLINCAAYTAVDRAESEPSLAEAVNSVAVRRLAELSLDHAFLLVHISTDFVFDGRQTTPYSVSDTPNPLSVYGATKYRGERAVTDVLGDAATIIRTAWVYDETGPNFVMTMLRLMASRPRVRVVDDQVGTPTCAETVAGALVAAVERDMRGTYHITDAGLASWYDFAVAIMEEGLAIGLLDAPVVIDPIPTADYPLPATRPAFAVLDKSASRKALGVEGTHWRVTLRTVLQRMRENRPPTP